MLTGSAARHVIMKSLIFMFVSTRRMRCAALGFADTRCVQTAWEWRRYFHIQYSRVPAGVYDNTSNIVWQTQRDAPIGFGARHAVQGALLSRGEVNVN